MKKVFSLIVSFFLFSLLSSVFFAPSASAIPACAEPSQTIIEGFNKYLSDYGYINNKSLDNQNNRWVIGKMFDFYTLVMTNGLTDTTLEFETVNGNNNLKHYMGSTPTTINGFTDFIVQRNDGTFYIPFPSLSENSRNPSVWWKNYTPLTCIWKTQNVTYANTWTDPHFPETEPPIQTLKPDFTYTVENKTITARDYNLELPTVTPDEGYTIQGYTVEWTLQKCKTYEGFPAFTCTGSNITEHQVLPQDTDFNFTVPDYGDYTLSAQYLVQECYRYPSYPSTPDYCFFVDLGAELGEAYDFTSTTEYLPINGQTTSGDTTGEDCTVSGFCVPPGVVCTMDDGFFAKLSCDMNKSMNTGLINPSINALKKVLTSLTVPTDPHCSIVISDVSISPGNVFPLSNYSDIACTKADELNTAFPISAIVINFFLAIIELLLIIRIFNRLTDHTKTDIIEGL